jgi:AcrR family transcriptional regulator
MAAEDGRVRSFLQLLWAPEQRPARGPKPGLRRNQIVDAAIGIADREGLEALTMRRVASEIGSPVMSLYRHVPGKDELIELMLDAALGDPPATDAKAGWRVQLTRWARACLARYRRHPWLPEAVVSRPPIGPNRLGWFDIALQAASGLGLAPRERVAVVLAVDSYVRGAAQVLASLERPASRTGISTAEWNAIYAQALEQVVTLERHPSLARLIAAGAFERSERRPDHFEFGLRRLLDGVELGKPKRRTPRRPRGGRA